MIRVIVGTVLATVFVIGLGMIALAAGGSRSLNSLPDPREPPVRDRDVRLPRPPQRDQHADVDRADAQRGQPLDRRVRLVRARRSGTGGSVIALLVMAVAAAEATVGLAIVIAIFRNKKTPLVDEYDAMRQ